MSRVGNNPIPIPNGTKVTISGNHIIVEGPKGKLEQDIHPRLKMEQKDGQILIKRSTDSRVEKSLHGLFRSLIANMMVGVRQGYTKKLQIQGVGFRAQLKDKSLSLSLGASHLIDFVVPDGVKVELPKPTQIIISGTSKQAVGEVAAKIRAFYKPEPYKGKGIRYVDEHVRHKAGKAVA